MKKFLATLFATIMWVTFLWADGTTVYFTSDPTLSPNGEQVVFCYENDLWTVESTGGVAYRLTAMEGIESLPRFSPDGKWLAFTATQSGKKNVYVMPAKGGEIKQLTFHNADDLVDSWSWDSKWIYFSSTRYNFVSAYKISIDGGTPIRLFDHYFNNPHHMVQHPITNDYFFTDSWESFNFSHRKHYKGDHSPQILSYNTSTKEFKQRTTYKGKDMWPTIDKAGNIFFVSDELNGEYNLYQLKDGNKVSLTKFDESMKRPQVSANGKYIVFEKDYQLCLYDVAAASTQKVQIELSQNQTLGIEKSYNVQGRISSFDVSPDGKKLAFVSRGALFVSDAKGKFIRRIPVNPAERVFEVKWSNDNSTLIYSQTYQGWPNWFTISATGVSDSKQLTYDERTNRMLSLNPDRTAGVYLSGRDEVRLLDLKTGKSKVIVNDELWGFQNSAPSFSPDGKYVSFTAYRAFEQDVFIHELATAKTINLTNTMVTESQPTWSPDGKYIYFVGNRYAPSYPRGSGGNSIYRIPLYRFTTSFKNEAFDELFAKESKKGAKKDSSTTIRIDLHNIAERWEEIRVPGGSQMAPTVIQQGDETVLLFLSTHDKGEMALWSRTFQPFEREKTTRLSKGRLGFGYQIASTAKNEIYILANNDIHKANLKANKLDKIDINHSFSKNLKEEFNQMFWEAWTIIQENFYEKGFHGIDWKAKRDYYASFLPHLRNRNNLRVVLNDMLGELNASHMGFTSWGDDERTFYASNTVALGVTYSENNPFEIQGIIRNSNLDITDPILQPGDIIIAVNDVRVDFTRNREEYFTFPAFETELNLTIKRKNKELKVIVPTHNTMQISSLLYDEWIAQNRDYTTKKSNGKVAYVHMKDMSAGSLSKFLIDMTTHAEHAEALVFDLRYNRGGNVHDAVLNFLAQKPYLRWQYREGALSPQPNFAPSGKPMILVINEHSLSDAEMTAAGFRELGLGKILGTETYRWIIFTSSKSLVDGSSVRVPGWGCYTLSGGNLELDGVAPDIYVNTTFKDRLDGVDPQLDKAIEEVLKDLK